MMDCSANVILWTALLLSSHSNVSSETETVYPPDCRPIYSGAVLCVGDSVTDIPSGMPLHTYLLRLNGTKMHVIKERSLANLDLLLRFSLTHSHLHTIHPAAFRVAQHFKSVKLSNNDLSTIPAQWQLVFPLERDTKEVINTATERAQKARSRMGLVLHVILLGCWIRAVGACPEGCNLQLWGATPHTKTPLAISPLSQFDMKDNHCSSNSNNCTTFVVQADQVYQWEAILLWYFLFCLSHHFYKTHPNSWLSLIPRTFIQLLVSSRLRSR
uniref:Uncharacterized protein n=1 Tax=Knipowitschia caucasica TaxID=637954 RepID=A0AAV2KVH0_KNICA